MFINKFNKLIRNKWIWGIFAVLVCFLFVASDLFRGDDGAGRENSFGTLDGEPVTYEQYQNALLAVHIDDVLSNRGRAVLDDSAARTRAWRFVAALRTAQKMGLLVSPAEVKQHVATAFADQTGAFNPAFYVNFVAEQFHCTPAQYEKGAAAVLLVSKVSSAAALANWTSPPLIDAQSRGQTDRYTLRTASISNSFDQAEVEVTDEKLSAFYELNKARYMVPDKVSVRFVSFPVADFADKVEEPEEDAVRFHYDENPSRYTEVVGGVSTNLSFDAARDKVVAELKAEGAVDLARAAAEEFAEAFFNDSHDAEAEAALVAPEFFEKAAKEHGLAVRKTELFARGDAIPDVDADVRADFTEAAFSLGPDASYDYYSDPVVGKSTVYVLSFGESVPEHEPGLDAVKEDVQKAVIAEERNRLFVEKVSQAYETYAAESEKGRDFDEVVAETGFTASTNMVMTAFDVRNLPGNPREWIAALPRLAVGESSTPVFYGTGATFVRVFDREAGDETMRESFKSRLSDGMRMTLGSSLSESWLEANYQSMNPDVPGEEE